MTISAYKTQQISNNNLCIPTTMYTTHAQSTKSYLAQIPLICWNTFHQALTTITNTAGCKFHRVSCVYTPNNPPKRIKILLVTTLRCSLTWQPKSILNWRLWRCSLSLRKLKADSRLQTTALQKLMEIIFPFETILNL